MLLHQLMQSLGIERSLSAASGQIDPLTESCGYEVKLAVFLEGTKLSAVKTL